jgi:hypothetical protein
LKGLNAQPIALLKEICAARLPSQHEKEGEEGQGKKGKN